MKNWAESEGSFSVIAVSRPGCRELFVEREQCGGENDKMMINIGTVIVIVLAAVVVAAVAAFLLGVRWRKNVAEKEISSAEEEARRTY